MKKCDQFDRFLRGQLTETALAHHLDECPACRLARQADIRLMEEAAQLRQSSPELPAAVWQRVLAQTRPATGLKPVDHPAAATWVGKLLPVLSGPSKVRPSMLRLVWLSAAVLILALAGGLIYYSRPPVPVKGLLAEAALLRVEAAERNYLDAIAELEKRADPQLSELPGELGSLYRLRLETIDAQILRCRTALASNPANAHIRRYLLAALHEKEETLRAITSAAKSVAVKFEES
jgi:hypothetical protein